MKETEKKRERQREEERWSEVEGGRRREER